MQRIDHQQFTTLLRQNASVLVVNTSPEEDAVSLGPIRWVHIPQEDRDFVQHVAAVLGSKDAPVIVLSINRERPDALDAGIKLDQSGFSRVFELTEQPRLMHLACSRGTR